MRGVAGGGARRRRAETVPAGGGAGRDEGGVRAGAAARSSGASCREARPAGCEGPRPGCGPGRPATRSRTGARRARAEAGSSGAWRLPPISLHAGGDGRMRCWSFTGSATGWCRGTAPGRTGRGRRGGSSHRTGRRHARGGGRRGAAGRHGTVGMCRNRRRPGGAGGCRAGGDAGGRVDRRDGRLRGDRPPTAGRWCGARPCSARVSWRERSPDGDGEGWSCRPAHAMADAGPSTAPRPAPMGRSTRVPDVWCTGRTARRDSGARRRTLPMDLPPRGTTCHRLSAHVERPPDWSAVDGARWNVLDGVTVRHGRRSRWSAAVAGRSGWRWPAGPGSGCAKTSPCVGRMTLVRLIRARRFSGAEDTVGVRCGRPRTAPRPRLRHRAGRHGPPASRSRCCPTAPLTTFAASPHAHAGVQVIRRDDGGAYPEPAAAAPLAAARVLGRRRLRVSDSVFEKCVLLAPVWHGRRT